MRFKKFFSKKRMIWVCVLLFLVLFYSIWWIWVQEVHFKDAELLNNEQAQTLISWELNRQLRMIVVALSSAIALITIIKSKIRKSAFIAGSIMSAINLLSLSKFVQSIQFVVHYEQEVDPEMYTQIFSKHEVFYYYFFNETGKLNQFGWIIVPVLFFIATLLWISLLNSADVE